MILQALTAYYETLAASGRLPRPGWSPASVSFALYLRSDGTLERIVDIRTEQQRGKKMRILPQLMALPSPVKRTSGPAANFLWDNAAYLLGLGKAENPQRARICFAASRELHFQRLAGVDSPAARALLAFFQNWDPQEASSISLLAEHREALLAGANLVFRWEGGYIHADPAI